MLQNAPQICFELTTIFLIGKFVANVLNHSKLKPQIPDWLKNQKSCLQTIEFSLELKELIRFQLQILKFVAIHGIPGLCGIPYKIHYLFNP